MPQEEGIQQHFPTDSAIEQTVSHRISQLPEPENKFKLLLSRLIFNTYMDLTY